MTPSSRTLLFHCQLMISSRDWIPSLWDFALNTAHHLDPHQTIFLYLNKILKDLKNAFWPFQLDHARSPFLRAADAARCVTGANNANESASQLASAKAARHRLQRGVWTSVHFGDMRRALSGILLYACERLILLKHDPKELRDYAVLLYHCGYYEEALQFLKHYQNTKQTGSDTNVEEEAAEKLVVRLNLSLMEVGWSVKTTGAHKYILFKNSQPCLFGCTGLTPKESVQKW
ncbi:uncharacterized protein LOC121808113 isoform X2 [Salvia splendens]|uniref:uncharacterized protein LOC121808113 isoform X2 n=1 Tax=Salvia splendens TaxID=180675 RepID=UPI001C2757B7|nr:uncharacterized protein LOC121808113 isoform X2 [Salvia splendens]